MGFLSPKKQEKPETAPPTTRRPGQADLWQIGYTMAYSILPHYAFKDLAKAVDMWVRSPRTLPAFFYLMACQVRKTEGITEEAGRFRPHQGALDSTRNFYAMEYPPPPPVDLTGKTPEEILKAGSAIVLAPYFSAIVCNRDQSQARYFVLGQRPQGVGPPEGLTTFREVAADGANYNCGPGSNPGLPAFLELIRNHLRKAPTALVKPG